jgi:hypothetical protein
LGAAVLRTILLGYLFFKEKNTKQVIVAATGRLLRFQ